MKHRVELVSIRGVPVYLTSSVQRKRSGTVLSLEVQDTHRYTKEEQDYINQALSSYMSMVKRLDSDVIFKLKKKKGG